MYRMNCLAPHRMAFLDIENIQVMEIKLLLMALENSTVLVSSPSLPGLMDAWRRS